MLLDQYGNEIAIEKAQPSSTLSPAYGEGSGAWLPIVRESFPGAWQRNVVIDNARAATFHADFSCKTLIARDIAKLRVKLMQEGEDGVWTPTKNPAYDPVLRVPNDFQTRNQFWEAWILSKLNRGNTYVLKARDNRTVVTALYVLDPQRCTPLIAEDGSVYYRLSADYLSGIEEQVVVPASEIIHDRFNCLFHPLVGLPPVFASALAATQGLNIQNNSALLFENNSTPGGILTAPGKISEPDANRIKDLWQQKFGGANRGRVAVLGDGLKYEKMALTAVEGQLIDQLKWTAEVVCSTYHVPPYKIGVGALPSYNNIQALNVEYYSQCLQSLIEDAEECLDRGLGIGWGSTNGLGTEFDLDNLLRMDSITQADVVTKLVGGGVMKPDEGRARFGMKSVPGGDTPYLQQQNFSLAALQRRDKSDDPFALAPKRDQNTPTPAEQAAAEAAAQNGASASQAAGGKNAKDEEIAAAKIVAAWKLRSLLVDLPEAA